MSTESYTVRPITRAVPSGDKWEIVGHYVEADGSTSDIPIATHKARKGAETVARLLAGRKPVRVVGRR